MEMVIIIKSTGLHCCINLYCHRWISNPGCTEKQSDSPKIRAVLDDKESAMSPGIQNVQLYPGVH